VEDSLAMQSSINEYGEAVAVFSTLLFALHRGIRGVDFTLNVEPLGIVFSGRPNSFLPGYPAPWLSSPLGRCDQSFGIAVGHPIERYRKIAGRHTNVVDVTQRSSKDAIHVNGNFHLLHAEYQRTGTTC
jgi:hypothetical protein